MFRSFGLATLLACVAAVASVNAQFTTNQGAFMGGLVGSSYLEAFDNFVDGVTLSGQATWDSPVVNGYSFQASAPPNGLWSLTGAISTNNNGDPVVFTFTGAPVTAFGGNFFGTDVAGNVVTADVTFTTNGGDVFTHNVTGLAGSFLGFYSAAPLVSVSISTNAGNWATADNVVSGNAIPEPGTAALGLLGLLGLVANRRRSC